ncbi:hypothetical protein GGI15_003775 [Coemansia interrupta]|uniref:Protein kinase domain-containing protein n=1 Tax=Coemansia interrupta TaxID=1126814 RepID=A0A9W8H9D1_9FUNG|nr:hypothetical protein GGI15_003775 [Coemansia interrupta]
MSICGSMAYLYTKNFNGRPAVLKLTWAQVGRTSEGAVYDLLHRCKVPGVSTVYDSRVIVPDFHGFRLEYLVIEDCGMQIIDYIATNRNDDNIGEVTKGLVEQVVECLVSANSNGILHRDISAENIAVRNGTARVSD